MILFQNLLALMSDILCIEDNIDHLDYLYDIKLQIIHRYTLDSGKGILIILLFR